MDKPPPAARCAKLGKVRYPTWLLATQRLIKHAHDGVSIYSVHKCRWCDGYHLTTHNMVNSYKRTVPKGNARRSKKNRR